MSLFSSSFIPLIIIILIIILLSIPPPSYAQNQTQLKISSFSFSDPPWRPLQNKVLTSNNSLFAAGFLPLPTSPNLFTFTIWYLNISQSKPTIIWSANDNSPVNQSSSLVISPSGELRLTNSSSGKNLWPPTAAQSNSTELNLTGDGNLVFGNWDSFSYPTHTILPNQGIKNGTILSSINGKYKFVGGKQLVFNDSDSYYTVANGNAFLKLDNDGRVSQDKGVSFICSDLGYNRLRRLTIDEDGNLRIYSFDPDLNGWTVVWQAMFELCTIYGACGPNFICMYNDGFDSTVCVCPPGFRTVSGSGGETCERKIPIKDPGNSKFLQMDYVNYSGGSNQNYQTMVDARNFFTCEAKCLGNPSCVGFGFKYDGSGYCVHLERLVYGYWSPSTETAMFLWVDGSETDVSNFTGMSNVLETTCPVQVSLPLPPDESKSTTRNIAIICTIFAAELISGVAFFWAFLKNYVKYRDMARTLGLEFLPTGGPKRFSYAELKVATNNFSNCIGKGGFGDVYGGELSDHRVVAVKCLKNVAGGDGEFWAEVTIIARMHHLNLVRLWGFCAEKGQRILVYEYVPNGSLDSFLFHSGTVEDSNGAQETGANGQKPALDWGIRYRIALGVARAIAYLHEECLEWVLHCDIKPGNILIGDDFCPKLSDFGLSKLRKKEDMISCSRMLGTRGYMAPEWVKSNQITPKADVYSFGMVLLEIVTGIRNFEIQGSRMDSENWYFPRWTFDKVFKEMNVEDILDRRIKQSYDSRAHFDMINRMVKTAMWCLQDGPEMRPSMGKVAKMLEGTVEIMEPKRPTIFFLDD